MPQAVNYWSEGAMQPIDLDEVAFYAPTYWDKMKDTIETYGKLDGENAFIFAEREPIYGGGAGGPAAAGEQGQKQRRTEQQTDGSS